MSLASATRHSSTYCIGGIPIVRANRSANTAESAGQTRIRKSGDQTAFPRRRASGSEPAGLDQQYLDEPLQNHLAARMLRNGLLGDEVHDPSRAD
jgi:hypothetical protein